MYVRAVPKVFSLTMKVFGYNLKFGMLDLYDLNMQNNKVSLYWVSLCSSALFKMCCGQNLMLDSKVIFNLEKSDAKAIIKFLRPQSINPQLKFIQISGPCFLMPVYQTKQLSSLYCSLKCSLEL